MSESADIVDARTAAEILGKSVTAVRLYAVGGVLKIFGRGGKHSNARRLFKRSDVEKFRLKLSSMKGAKKRAFLANVTAKHRKRNAERKAAGLCMGCGKVSVSGKTECCSCAAKKVATKKIKRRKWRDLGLCYWCGGEPVIRYGLCRPCANKNDAKRNVRTAKRKAAGLCVRCGTCETNGKSYCASCLDKWRVYRKARMDSLKRANQGEWKPKLEPTPLD